MTKRELAKRIADGGEVPDKLALWATEAVCEAIATALEREEPVNLAGFGKFSVAERAAREARNPRTGETVAGPARRVPRFSAAAALKERVARAGAPA